MNLDEFLTHPDIQLPMRWDSNGDCDGFVEQRWNLFLDLIDEVPESIPQGKVGKLRDTCRRMDFGQRALSRLAARSNLS